MKNITPIPNSFPALAKILWDRLRTPMGSPSFWNNLACGVVLFGGVAVWIELIKYGFNLPGTHPAEGVRTAFNTYFAAVGCGSSLQLVTAEKENQDVRAFGYAASVCFIFVCIAAFLLQIHHPKASMAVGVVFSFLALVMWCVANGFDEIYTYSNPNASLGGPIEKPLPGTTEGYQL
jgi:hypothetical protein